MIQTMDETSIAVRRDADGYLVDPREWTEEVAVAIAREAGVQNRGHEAPARPEHGLTPRPGEIPC